MLKFGNKSTLVFSTGGFVSVPVVLAAKLTGKTIYIHEQTTEVGLANRICSKFADKIFISFENSRIHFPSDKTVFSGYPVRDECFNSTISDVIIEGVHLNTIKDPILFVTGGGNGSQLINDYIKDNIEYLKREFFIVHQVGQNYIDEYKKYKCSDYLPVTFINHEMIDLYKLSKIVISRAGAGTVCELMALKKRSIFIPLKIAQRNEQYRNALEAKEKIGSMILEEDMIEDTNMKKLLEDFRNMSNFQRTTLEGFNAKDFLVSTINEFFNKSN